MHHAAVLGIERGEATRAEMHKAYRQAAKDSHPDRFAHDARQRAEAEERFKLIQIAFRELTEHNPEGWTVAVEEADQVADQVEPVPAPAQPVPPGASLTFGGARGCYTGARIPQHASDLIHRSIGSQDSPLAVIDLEGGAGSALSQFLVLATHGLLQRDALRIVSLLSYADVGKLCMVDQRTDPKTGFLRKMMWKLHDAGPALALEIWRRNGELFCTLENPVEDGVKALVQRFIEERKQQYGAA
ncbi:MAG TPA: J domain-containing protein [Terracidiphilus sp.]|nr:J domain-containing protein [Terracidiphilus sp.]